VLRVVSSDGCNSIVVSTVSPLPKVVALLVVDLVVVVVLDEGMLIVLAAAGVVAGPEIVISV